MNNQRIKYQSQSIHIDFSCLRIYLIITAFFELYAVWVIIYDGIPNELPPLKYLLPSKDLERAYVYIIIFLAIMRLYTSIHIYNPQIYTLNMLIHIGESIVMLTEVCTNGSITREIKDALLSFNFTYIIVNDSDLIILLGLVWFQTIWIIYKYPSYINYRDRYVQQRNITKYHLVGKYLEQQEIYNRDH
eukprot:TRINITY_DN16801_c0_g1_i1.p1 TRINITY_DN16801_c0_g1~~TRINITY_DN16801_c0_g1_i1.p1  ORF type:complete len:189 (+),score=4.47 TRINITY_DN16801_c0_g1_i1:215-781(+)